MEQQPVVDGLAQLVEQQDGIAEVSNPGRLPTVHVTLKVAGMAPGCWNCGQPLSDPGKLLVTKPDDLEVERDHIVDRRQLILICEHCDSMLVRLEGTVNWS